MEPQHPMKRPEEPKKPMERPPLTKRQKMLIVSVILATIILYMTEWTTVVTTVVSAVVIFALIAAGVYRLMKERLFFGFDSGGLLERDSSGRINPKQLQNPGHNGQPQIPRQPEPQKKPRQVKLAKFSDVAGCKEAKKELAGVVEYLRDRDTRLLSEYFGGQIPKGLLFHGPAGTGKTLLARAIAGEAKVPFIVAGGSEFDEQFVGVGAKRMRNLFAEAREKAPCILFIDEIDAIGSRDKGGNPSGTGTLNQTLNQLLIEMDGFGPNEGVILIAATNKLESLDKALTRTGRFDKKIHVGLPDLPERVEGLKIHTRNKPIGVSVKFDDIAKMTCGFSGSDLENLCSEAANISIKRVKSDPGLYKRLILYLGQAVRAGVKIKPIYGIPHSAFVEAWDTVVSGGDAKVTPINDREKKSTAVHEAGHALIAYIRHILNPEDTMPLYKVSIIPRGGALGLTYRIPTEDIHTMTKKRAQDDLLVNYGGWAAEKVVMGTTASGVTQDIERATALVKRMVLEWGMSNNLPPMHLASSGKSVFGESRSDKYSGATEDEINKEIRELITIAHKKAELMIQKNRKALDAFVEALLEKETLDQRECEKIFKENISAENLKTEAYSTKKAR